MNEMCIFTWIQIVYGEDDNFENLVTEETTHKNDVKKTDEKSKGGQSGMTLVSNKDPSLA